VREWDDAIAFVPLDPVTDGHVLVVPRRHVRDAVEDSGVTAAVMLRAVELAGEAASSNILTSAGTAATQSIFHLHIHVVPREVGDELMLPWGTTGDPHAPHWCKVADRLQRELDQGALRRDRKVVDDHTR
jgi:histidine triad (HIT) family protein